MISLRIINVDYYMSSPIPELDVVYSSFRGTEVRSVPVIQIFGPSSTGEKTCLHIHGVFPYIYIPCDRQEDYNQLSYKIASELDKSINTSFGQASANTIHIHKISLVSGRPLYGFHEKEHLFFKIYFYNPMVIKRACTLLENGSILGRCYQPHESHINYILQFLIDHNLYGMSFINLSNVKYRTDQENRHLFGNIPADLLLPNHITRRSYSQTEVDAQAADITNVRDMPHSNEFGNPGLALICNDEKQRRRNNDLDSQLSFQLTQDRGIIKSTISHQFFKSKFLDKLAIKDSGETTASDLNKSVYPSETPESGDIFNMSATQNESLNETTLKASVEQTETDDFLNERDDNLLLILYELKENVQIEDGSILSQQVLEPETDSVVAEEEEEEALSLTTPLSDPVVNDVDDAFSQNSYFERSLHIPQIDGEYDVFDNQVLDFPIQNAPKIFNNIYEDNMEFLRHLDSNNILLHKKWGKHSDLSTATDVSQTSGKDVNVFDPLIPRNADEVYITGPSVQMPPENRLFRGINNLYIKRPRSEIGSGKINVISNKVVSYYAPEQCSSSGVKHPMMLMMEENNLDVDCLNRDCLGLEMYNFNGNITAFENDSSVQDSSLNITSILLHDSRETPFLSSLSIDTNEYDEILEETVHSPQDMDVNNEYFGDSWSWFCPPANVLNSGDEDVTSNCVQRLTRKRENEPGTEKNRVEVSDNKENKYNLRLYAKHTFKCSCCNSDNDCNKIKRKTIRKRKPRSRNKSVSLSKQSLLIKNNDNYSTSNTINEEYLKPTENVNTIDYMSDTFPQNEECAKDNSETEKKYGKNHKEKSDTCIWNLDGQGDSQSSDHSESSSPEKIKKVVRKAKFHKRENGAPIDKTNNSTITKYYTRSNQKNNIETRLIDTCTKSSNTSDVKIAIDTQPVEQNTVNPSNVSPHSKNRFSLRIPKSTNSHNILVENASDSNRTLDTNSNLTENDINKYIETSNCSPITKSLLKSSNLSPKVLLIRNVENNILTKSKSDQNVNENNGESMARSNLDLREADDQIMNRKLEKTPTKKIHSSPSRYTPLNVKMSRITFDHNDNNYEPFYKRLRSNNSRTTLPEKKTCASSNDDDEKEAQVENLEIIERLPVHCDNIITMLQQKSTIPKINCDKSPTNAIKIFSPADEDTNNTICINEEKSCNYKASAIQDFEFQQIKRIKKEAIKNWRLNEDHFINKINEQYIKKNKYKKLSLTNITSPKQNLEDNVSLPQASTQEEDLNTGNNSTSEEDKIKYKIASYTSNNFGAQIEIKVDFANSNTLDSSTSNGKLDTEIYKHCPGTSTIINNTDTNKILSSPNGISWRNRRKLTSLRGKHSITSSYNCNDSMKNKVKYIKIASEQYHLDKDNYGNDLDWFPNNKNNKNEPKSLSQEYEIDLSNRKITNTKLSGLTVAEIYDLEHGFAPQPSTSKAKDFIENDIDYDCDFSSNSSLNDMNCKDIVSRLLQSTPKSTYSKSNSASQQNSQYSFDLTLLGDGKKSPENNFSSPQYSTRKADVQTNLRSDKNDHDTSSDDLFASDFDVDMIKSVKGSQNSQEPTEKAEHSLNTKRSCKFTGKEKTELDENVEPCITDNLLHLKGVKRIDTAPKHDRTQKNSPDISDDLNRTLTDNKLFDMILTDEIKWSNINVKQDKRNSIQNGNIKYVLMPKYIPPTPGQVKATLSKYNIPENRYQQPFYSDYNDVTGKIEIGHNVLKIPSKSYIDYEEFVPCVNFVGLEALRKQTFEELYPSQDMSKCNLKIALTGHSSLIITPAMLPPSKAEVTSWLKRKMDKPLKIDKPSVVVKPRIVIRLSPENGNESLDESYTLSPCSPVTPGTERVSPTPSDSSDVIYSSPTSHKTPPSFRKGKSKRRGILQRKVLFSQTVKSSQGEKNSNDLPAVNLNSLERSSNNSCQITGATLNNTHGFRMSLENLQNAKALAEYQYITVMVAELHIQTRADFHPDPQYDPIRAIFYSIFNDVPEDYATPREETGIFVVDTLTGTPPKYKIPPLLDGAGLNCNITYVKSERELIDSFVKFIHKTDPDIIAGYEIEMLSWGYLVDRCSNIEINLRSMISRINSSVVKSRSEQTDSSHDFQLPGRIVLDIWRLFRHEIALQSYTFENMMYHVLHRRVPMHSFKDLSFWWEHRSNCYRSITAKYYLERVQGVLKLLDQLDIIGRTSELARLFGIQFYEVLSRGSQFRVESMMLRLAKPLNYIPVSPSVQQRAKMKAPEWLPLIFEPKSRLYTDPIIVLDFQSLYPSIIIAYNYCFSTCIGRVEKIVPNEPFEFGATQLKISRRALEKIQNKLNYSPCGVGFIRPEVRQGVLPKMLQEILETRLMVKKSMKENKDNKVLQRVLHNRQLGLKLIANVTYGYTAANFSGRMPCVEVGDSVVSKGRETLERAIKLIEETKKWSAEVVYGDTDSLFVLVSGRSRKDAFKIGAEIAEAVTNDNPPPVKLKLEKVYQPCILQTKKRYVGYMYESPDQTDPEYNAKGIETVRRDGCPAVAKMLEKSLRLLFETKDVSLVKRYICRQFSKIQTGRVSIQDLTFAREYRGASGYRPGACVPALELARKWAATDKRREPRRGERVPYVIVSGPPGLPLIRLVRCPRELLAEPATLRPNAVYYITRVIIPALNRCFTLIGADINTWYNEMPHKQLQYLPTEMQNENIKKSTISQYFATTSCAACGNQTQTGLCENCRASPQRTALTLQQKLNAWEQSHRDIRQICESCCGRTEHTNCITLDCPVLYRLTQNNRDLKQVPFLRNLLKRLLD